MKFQILSFALFLMGAPAQASSGLGFSFSSASPSPGQVQVLVQDEATGAPIEGATVEVTDSLERKGSILTTDSDGLTSFAAPAKKIITVTKTDYTRISVAGVSALSTPNVVIDLKRMMKASTVLGSGEMTGWATAPTRGSNVKAGLVFRALNPSNLLEFNIEAIISPLIDTIDAWGPRQIPSNFVLPKQKVVVGVIPVNLNKPGYRLPVRAGKEFRLGGIQVEVGAMDLVNAGNRPMRILNKAKFKKLGITETMNPSADFVKNVDANETLTQSYQVTANRPPFVSNVLVLALNDIDGDRETLLFSDVKLAVDQEKPNEVKSVNLVSAKNLGKSQHIVTVALTDDSKQLSGIITQHPGAQVMPGDFLPITRRMQRSLRSGRSGQVDLTAPSQGVGLAQYESAAGTQWMVYALPGSGVIRIPAQTEALALMHLDFGTAWNSRELDGSRILRQLARFSRVASAAK